MISKFRKKMNYQKLFTVLALGSVFFLWFNGANLALAAEKEYPNQPIKIIIPNDAGAFMDLSVRVMADYLNRELNVPNRITCCLRIYQSAPSLIRLERCGICWCKIQVIC